MKEQKKNTKNKIIYGIAQRLDLNSLFAFREICKSYYGERRNYIMKKFLTWGLIVIAALSAGISEFASQAQEEHIENMEKRLQNLEKKGGA